MTPMRRLRLGDLELSHHDVFERDIEYIYNEIFPGAAYDHPHIKLPERPTIIDVGRQRRALLNLGRPQVSAANHTGL